jgi:hypothetical protein
MSYPAIEKLEIIRLVEHLPPPVRRTWRSGVGHILPLA